MGGGKNTNGGKKVSGPALLPGVQTNINKKDLIGSQRSNQSRSNEERERGQAMRSQGKIGTSE